MHGQLKHWIFGNIPNDFQFNAKFKSSDVLSYLIWTFSKSSSCLKNTFPSWCLDVINVTLPKCLTHIRLTNTWIKKTIFLKLNDDMFRCILTKSSGQRFKSIKYHIYKATKSIGKIEMTLLQDFINRNATTLLKN